MSTFVDHLVDELAVKAIPSTSDSAQVDSSVDDTQQKQTLRSLLASLNPSTPLESLQEYFDHELRDVFSVPPRNRDKEEESLKKAVVGRMIVAVYAAALRTYLAEATEAESESEWWDNIGRSRGNLAWYFLQTLPSRLWELSRTIIRAFDDPNTPLRFSDLNSAAFRQIFPSNGIFHRNTLIIAMFPHLRNQPQLLSFSLFTSRPFSFLTHFPNSVPWLATLKGCMFTLSSAITLPINLARQECVSKRRELERLRDERAEVLGMLTDMRGRLSNIFTEQSVTQDSYFDSDPYYHAVRDLRSKFKVEPLESGLFVVLETSVHAIFDHRRDHKIFLNVNRLRRPSRLTLVWPNLILSPLVVLYACKSVYASRAPLIDMMIGAWETARGFWKGWLVDPLKDVLRTVRIGSEDGVIVQREALAADLSSLERMVLSLAQDELNYSADQLTGLSAQIRQGNLTAVLELYEQSIKSPVKSALTGTLLRSLFIQVQKAKVDINQALSGIDKLLKSQELTFAFVGVAPALSLVYITAGYLRGLWSGGEWRGLYGGERRRTTAWLAMRRIERLLIGQSHALNMAEPTSLSNIPPLTTGLLLLSVTRLRYFAENFLPPSSRIREGFLEDIKDLEDPDLGRHEKLRIVDRMWRCWGASLKWDQR